MKKYLFLLWLLALLPACAGKIPPVEEVPVPPIAKSDPLQIVSWSDVDGWEHEAPAAALETFRKSCRAVGHRDRWQNVCELAKHVEAGDEQGARQFFESFFQPFQVINVDGSTTGLMTGYYGPELSGSRVPTETYKYPIYGQPKDLLVIDLDEIYPELSNYRLRGRLVGNRVVPYYQREEIDNGAEPLAGQELFWVEDPVELFFLHIQGSGRIRLPDGNLVMVSYANQNGHPYQSIGKLLLQRKAMTREQMSMQNIRRWVEANPEAGEQLLAENPSYVFFRELAADVKSPPGALGVPLTAERSLAVDPRIIPLGAPVFVATTWPGSGEPLNRLMVAQDTGGAIKGRVRADFFWGMGDDAGQVAGRMKQTARLWVLLPVENPEVEPSPNTEEKLFQPETAEEKKADQKSSELIGPPSD